MNPNNVSGSNHRCAACKYLRRKCPYDCIFSPHFPPNNPQKFSSVHRIYGASNVGKLLQVSCIRERQPLRIISPYTPSHDQSLSQTDRLPLHLRSEAAESLYYEAKCRIEDPVYGCVGIISQIQEEIKNTETQLAKAIALIAFYQSNANYQLPL